MVRKLVLGCLLVACGVLLTACGGQDALPTLIPVETQAAESAPAETTSVEPTVTPTATTVITRPTLPPTFTPTASPTAEPTVAPVFPSPTIFTSFATPDPNCDNFVADFAGSTSEFVVGQSPRIQWSAIPGAELYRVIIRQDNDRIVNDQIYIAETFFDIPPDLLPAGAAYGWSVFPINARGDQMCFATGSILIPMTPTVIPSG